MQFHALRSTYPRFVFQSYRWWLEASDLWVQFEFQVGDHHFSPTVQFLAIPDSCVPWLASDEAKHYFLHLGMIEAISYWKATCSPVFEVAAGWLSPAQLKWWHELFLNGLGEFFYVNQIALDDPHLLTFECRQSATPASSTPLATLVHPFTDEATGVVAAAAANASVSSNELENLHLPSRTRFLVGVGGGKDSAVTLGLLDQLNTQQNNRFAYGVLLLTPQSPAAAVVAKTSKAVAIHQVHRQLDPQLLELNRQGFLNGHTPFSAYFAFVSILAARLYGYEQVVVSNEQSANEGNLQWHGRTINHQYSKTFAFESAFRTYLDQWFGEYAIRPGYFSLLRPLHEVQIAELFAHYPAFWPSFRSCNVGQKTNSWCEHCPKCVFVYTMLACFLEKSVLVGQIFSKDLLDDITLLPIVEQLIGYEANKPFECVGSQQEVLAALAHFTSLQTTQHQPLSACLTALHTKLGERLKPVVQMADLLKQWHPEHAIPNDLEFALKDMLKLTSTTHD